MEAVVLLQAHEYEALGGFRCGLRGVLGSSETRARALGVSPQQHQVLLVVAGHGEAGHIGTSELAKCLHVKVHTVSELVGRMVEAQLLERAGDPTDRRRIKLSLSDRSRQHLARLARAHADEILRLRELLETTLEKLAAKL